MLRPILALIIAASIIVLVWQYASFTERIRLQPIQLVEQGAKGRYDVRVSCTFDCQGDAFASSMKIQFRDRVLTEKKTELVAAGQVVTIRGVPDVKVGKNEFFVKLQPVKTIGDDRSAPANPAFSLDRSSETKSEKTTVVAPVARAVKVEILRDGYAIASKVYWSDLRGPIGESIMVEVGKDTHGH